MFESEDRMPCSSLKNRIISLTIAVLLAHLLLPNSLSYAQTGQAAGQPTASSTIYRNTGVSAGLGVGYEAKVIAKWPSGDVVGDPVVGADGIVYITTSTDVLHPPLVWSLSALNPVTGVVMWSINLPGGLYGTPAVGTDGKLYLNGLQQLSSTSNTKSSTALQGDMLAVDEKSGAICWQKSMPIDAHLSNLLGDPEIIPNGAIVAAAPSSIYAFDSANGAIKWTTALTGSAGNLAIGSDESIYVGARDGDLPTTASTGYIAAIDGDTGAIKWKFAAGDFFTSTPAVGPKDIVYACSGQNILYALNKATGKLLWKKSLRWKDEHGKDYMGYDSSSVAIGTDGTIYMQIDTGKKNDKGVEEYLAE